MPVSSLAEVEASVVADPRDDPGLDDQGWQSFPASDPPSTWWGGSGDPER
jgi:hypothetical protein